jgi:hypothetical protein
MKADDNREDTWMVMADFLEDQGVDTEELRAEIVEEDYLPAWSWERKEGVGVVSGAGIEGVGGTNIEDVGADCIGGSVADGIGASASCVGISGGVGARGVGGSNVVGV